MPQPRLRGRAGASLRLRRPAPEWRLRLAGHEGIFAEPQGITTYAGLLQAWQEGTLRTSEVVVCVITGIGLKDMGAAAEICADPCYPKPQRVQSLDEPAPFLSS